MLFTSWIALCGWNKFTTSLLRAIYSIHAIHLEPHARLPSFLLGSFHQALCVSLECHTMSSPVGPSHPPQLQMLLRHSRVFTQTWSSHGTKGLLICTCDLCCCVAPDLAPTPPLSRTASCPWSLHHCLCPTDSTSSAWSIALGKPCTRGLSNNLWRALTATVQPYHGQESTDKAMSWLCKARENFLHRPRCWSVRARHLKLVLIHLIWFISGFRRRINDCTFLLWCSCLDLSVNTSPSHCSTKMRGQRSTIFLRYSTWNYSAPSWKGDEKGYSAMRTAPLIVCFGLKSSRDMSQMHHCCNNGALILCTKKNHLWEDLCLKPTKTNTEHGSGPVRQESLPGQGTTAVILFDFKTVCLVLSESD